MKTRIKPGVTVLMPVYNGEKNLVKTVQSIQGQTFRNFEFIIVDDGSTDGTRKLLNQCARTDKRIRIIKNITNLGIVGSLNRGLRTAKGDLVARIDCGDICAPQRLSLQYKYFYKFPRTVLLGTQINRVNKEGILVGRTSLPEDNIKIRESLFLKQSVITHPSAMFRRIKGLYYRENAYPAEDYDYWLRILEYGEAANLHECLVYLVNDPASISHTNWMKQIIAVNFIRNSLLDRLKFGKEIHELPNLRSIHKHRWIWVTRLYGYKIKNNYYKYHPMNFFIHFLMGILYPTTIINKTPLIQLIKYLHRKEFRKFCIGT